MIASERCRVCGTTIMPGYAYAIYALRPVCGECKHTAPRPPRLPTREGELTDEAIAWMQEKLGIRDYRPASPKRSAPRLRLIQGGKL